MTGRQEWAVRVAQHAAEVVRVLRIREGHAEVRVLLPDAERVFSGAIRLIGNVPGGAVQERVESLILDGGLTVDVALRRAGC